jgi:AraC-like DNA-binding protein
LIRTTRPIKQIAADAGYADRWTFSRAFLRQSGVLPSDFRQSPQGRAHARMPFPLNTHLVAPGEASRLTDDAIIESQHIDPADQPRWGR